MTDFKFDPRKTALLNIDMQNCFVENSPLPHPGDGRSCHGSTSWPKFAASVARS